MSHESKRVSYGALVCDGVPSQRIVHGVRHLPGYSIAFLCARTDVDPLEFLDSEALRWSDRELSLYETSFVQVPFREGE